MADNQLEESLRSSDTETESSSSDSPGSLREFIVDSDQSDQDATEQNDDAQDEETSSAPSTPDQKTTPCAIRPAKRIREQTEEEVGKTTKRRTIGNTTGPGIRARNHAILQLQKRKPSTGVRGPSVERETPRRVGRTEERRHDSDQEGEDKE